MTNEETKTLIIEVLQDAGVEVVEFEIEEGYDPQLVLKFFLDKFWSNEN